MTTHATIDLETVDIRPTSVILSLGGVKFNPHNRQEPHSEIYFKISVDDQDRFNRTTNDSTIQWWSQQDPQIMEEAFDQTGAVTIEEVCSALSRWAVGVDIFWGQGYGFDFTILEDLFRNIQRPIPWQFWQIRDSRTLFGLCNEDPRKTMQTDKHNALADAYYQALAIQIAYKELNIKK